MVIRYFSLTLNKVVSTFLGLINLYSERAEAIASTLTCFLQSIGLDIKKCIGLGTDGCSGMVGTNNSMYTRLLQKKQNLQLLKCVCHSIQLCVSKAVTTLPRNVDYLASHSHNWLSQCSSLLQVCKDLQLHQFWWNPFESCTDVRYTVADHPWLLFAHTQSVGRAEASLSANQRPPKMLWCWNPAPDVQWSCKQALPAISNAFSTRIQQDQHSRTGAIHSKC